MVSLKVDENLPAEVTALFNEAGHDAMSINDQNMVGSADAHIASICKLERRAIVTLDLDFADIRSYPPEDYFGLIVLRLHYQDKVNVIKVLASLLAKLENEPLIGKLWIVTERSLRIRG